MRGRGPRGSRRRRGEVNRALAEAGKWATRRRGDAGEGKPRRRAAGTGSARTHGRSAARVVVIAAASSPSSYRPLASSSQPALPSSPRPVVPRTIDTTPFPTTFVQGDTTGDGEEGGAVGGVVGDEDGDDSEEERTARGVRCVHAPRRVDATTAKEAEGPCPGGAAAAASPPAVAVPPGVPLSGGRRVVRGAGWRCRGARCASCTSCSPRSRTSGTTRSTRPRSGARFRAPSRPLDDARCRDLRPGDPLCVACALAGGVELKFFDAVLESVRTAPALLLLPPAGCSSRETPAKTQVSPAAHETVDGEERCACRFSVRWAEGPLAGAMAEVGVEQVCCVRSNNPVRDPVLAEFLDGVVSKSPGDDGEGSATAASRSSGAVAP
ncbi:hypothetical protein OsJ_18392 [Oryza sativa Japonica Group]|uniref:SAWADEE domain-containing protein n=1 Tax=Oryza sativa subsp. japonica TaxID=39947 RepID=B9FPD4_ORYSJ|nr:hypothetical protein OsJ_18392 [Oryza sativa Japonica Group]